MANYNDLATTYANQRRAEYENSLGYLTTDALNANNLAISGINSQYDTILNRINSQRLDVTDTYNDAAKQAYINKMLSGRTINNQLQELGIATQGMGVQAQIANENAYGQNLFSARKTRDIGMRNIDNQVNESEGNRATALANQEASYANVLADINKQKQQMADAYYNQQYANYIADLKYQDELRQREWERQMEEKKYQLDLAQYQASLARASYGGGNYSQHQNEPAGNPPSSKYVATNSSVKVNGKIQELYKDKKTGKKYIYDNTTGTYVRYK